MLITIITYINSKNEESIQVPGTSTFIKNLDDLEFCS